MSGKLKIKKLIVPSSSFDSNVGLVAIGSLADAHEAILEASQEAPDSIKINPLTPNRGFYKAVRANPGVFPSKAEFNKNLIYAKPGQWKATRLVNPMLGNMMCGAVLWHEDLLGDSGAPKKGSDLAAYIREVICLEGEAGQYNTNEESNSFVQAGGRIVGRMTWDVSWEEGKRNQALDRADEQKFRFAAVEGRIGPDFAFFPVDSYFSSVWPKLRKLGFGYQDDDDSEDEDDGPDNSFLQSYQDGFYTFFHQQEYLAGRIIVATDSEDEAKIPVVRCILLFTYSCPEQIGDATLDCGIPISGKAATILAADDFWSYADKEDTSLAKLRDHMSFLSANKLLSLLEEVLTRQKQTKESTIRKILTAIYDPSTDSPKVYAPSLMSLHNSVFIYMDDVTLSNMIQILHSLNLLTGMVHQVQTDYLDGKQDWAPHSGKLLEKVTSLDCAKLLLDAGAHVDRDLIEERQHTHRDVGGKTNAEDPVTILLQSHLDGSSQGAEESKRPKN